MDTEHSLPGSHGEHALQREHNTTRRAWAFYDHQVLGRLNERMCDFVAEQEAVRRALADTAGRRPERWVMVRVGEAYVHCSKHIPLLAKRDKTIPWGTDDPVAKGGDHVGVHDFPRPWRRADE